MSLSVPVNVKLPMLLHPDTAKRFASKLDEDLARFGREMVETFEDAYVRLSNIDEGAAPIRADRDLSDEAKDRRITAVRARAFEGVVKNLERFQGRVASAVEREAAKLRSAAAPEKPTADAAEIRAFVHALPDQMAREKFLRAAAERGDRETIAAVIDLGPRRFLAGLEAVDDRNWGALQRDLLEGLDAARGASLRSLEEIHDVAQRALRATREAGRELGVPAFYAADAA